MVDIGADLQRAFDEGYEKGKADEHRWWSEFCANCTDGDRLQGEWIKTDRTYCGSTIYKCSVCGADIDEMPIVMGVPKYKSCPYCRTEMKGADDESMDVL